MLGNIKGVALLTNSAPRRPVVLFTKSPSIDVDEIRREFKAQGVVPIFANDINELRTHLQNPDVYCIFYAHDFEAKKLTGLSDTIGVARAHWIYLSPPLTAGASSQFFGLGFSDILGLPAHPVLIKNRSKIFLKRFSQRIGFAPEVELPADLKVSADPQPLRTVNQVIAGSKAPHILLESLRKKVLELREGVGWNEQLFSTAKLPRENSAQDISQKSLARCSQELSDLFKETAKTIGADRITLFSVKPTVLAVPERVRDLYVLVSSTPMPGNNRLIDATLVPQVTWCVERGRSILLNSQLPDPTVSNGDKRPGDFRLLASADVERSSAAIPLFANQKPFAVLFVQFAKECGPETIALLEQVTSYLGAPKIHYAHVDFLSRIYRQRD
jgi:hypothetical protein